MTQQRRSEVVFPELEPPEEEERARGSCAVCFLLFSVFAGMAGGAWFLILVAFG